MTAYAIFFYVLMFVLGSVMGSFVGAMTWRMKTNRDWVRGRSECERCHHKLAVIDLIPIFFVVRIIRLAISPRFATSTLEKRNIGRVTRWKENCE